MMTNNNSMAVQAPASAASLSVYSNIIFDCKGLDLYYGAFQALKKISMRIERNQITALIGPSGCGKSTFLRTLNRMNDLVPGCRVEGQVRRRYLQGNRSHCAAPPCRHGFPAAKPLPQEHL